MHVAIVSSPGRPRSTIWRTEAWPAGGGPSRTARDNVAWERPSTPITWATSWDPWGLRAGRTANMLHPTDCARDQPPPRRVDRSDCTAGVRPVRPRLPSEQVTRPRCRETSRKASLPRFPWPAPIGHSQRRVTWPSTLLRRRDPCGADAAQRSDHCVDGAVAHAIACGVDRDETGVVGDDSGSPTQPPRHSHRHLRREQRMTRATTKHGEGSVVGRSETSRLHGTRCYALLHSARGGRGGDSRESTPYPRDGSPSGQLPPRNRSHPIGPHRPISIKQSLGLRSPGRWFLLGCGGIM